MWIHRHRANYSFKASFTATVNKINSSKFFRAVKLNESGRFKARRFFSDGCMGLRTILGPCIFVSASRLEFEQNGTALAVNLRAAVYSPRQVPLISQGLFNPLQVHCYRTTPFLVELAVTALIRIRMCSANIEWETRAETRIGARSPHQLAVCKIPLADDSWIPTSGFHHRKTSMARCSQVIACKWGLNQSRTSLMA